MVLGSDDDTQPLRMINVLQIVSASAEEDQTGPEGGKQVVLAMANGTTFVVRGGPVAPLLEYLSKFAVDFTGEPIRMSQSGTTPQS